MSLRHTASKAWAKEAAQPLLLQAFIKRPAPSCIIPSHKNGQVHGANQACPLVQGDSPYGCFLQGSTPGFIKRWMRHLRSLPTQQTLTAADYDTLKGILLSALPRNHMATSAWSCAATLKRTEGLKRLSPEAPRGSNMQSCVSETATAVQSKRFRQQEEDDQEEYSMACGVTLMGSPEE